jgi:hypothetical protein
MRVLAAARTHILCDRLNRHKWVDEVCPDSPSGTGWLRCTRCGERL